MKKWFALALCALMVFSGTAMAQTWQEAYIDFVDATLDDSIGYDLFQLVDIDGDEIPELFYASGYTAGGDRLVFFHDGAAAELFLYSDGLNYIPGANLLRDCGGHMDEYYDAIYTLADGQAVRIALGEYGAEDNSDVRYDADGDPIYQYFWNGEPLADANAYAVCLNAVFDAGLAVSPYDGAYWDDAAGNWAGNGLCGRDAIKDAIRSYVPYGME